MVAKAEPVALKDVRDSVALPDPVVALIAVDAVTAGDAIFALALKFNAAILVELVAELIVKFAGPEPVIEPAAGVADTLESVVKENPARLSVLIADVPTTPVSTLLTPESS